MRRTEPMQTNPEDAKTVRQNSWLCRAFQENNVKPEEKVEILRAVTAHHKRSRLQSLKSS